MNGINGLNDWLAAGITEAQEKSPQSGGGAKNEERVTSVARDTLEYSKKDNFYYRKGHNTATLYMNQMDKALVNSFIERLDLDSVVKKIALENGYTGSAFKMFKKGFTDLIVHLKEDLINDGLFPSRNLDSCPPTSNKADSALEEYVLQRGAEVALRFYQDPSNLELLVKLFNKKFDISEVFYDYMKTTRFYLKYVDTISNGGVGTIDVLNTVDFEACKKGFIREMDKFFKQDEGKFVALTKSPSQLADEIGADPPKLPKQKEEKVSYEAGYSSITQEGLEILANSKDDPYYKKGAAAAMKYFDQLTPEIIQKIETYNFSKVAEKKARKEGCKDKELVQFKKGFFDATEDLRKQLKKDGVFDSAPLDLSYLQTSSDPTAPPPEYFLQKGTQLAKQYYEDAANRDSLVIAYGDRSQLRKLFDEYSFKANLRLLYIPAVSEEKRDRYEIANSLSIGLCYNGFLQEMNQFFIKESLKFNALKLDIGALVDSIENTASTKAESGGGKKKKKKKSTRVKPELFFIPPKNIEKPIVNEEAGKVPSTICKVPLNNTSDEKRAKHALKEKAHFTSIVEKIATDGVCEDAFRQLSDMIRVQSEKVEKMQRFYDALAEGEKKFLAKKVLDSAMDILTHFENEYKKVTAKVVEEEVKPAALKPSVEPSASAAPANVGGAVRNVQQYHALSSGYNENGQFSVKIHTIVKAVLILHNKDGIPIELSGHFTELQMQTLKVCLIHMIQNGVFNDRAGIIPLEGIVADLNRAIPDNRHTLDINNQLAYNQWRYFQEYNLRINPYHNALGLLEASGFRFSV